MIDNIGGILTASWCIASRAKSVAVTPSGILVNLPALHPWKQFPAVRGNIAIEVTEDIVNGSPIYNVQGTIRCPRKRYATTPEMVALRGQRIIVQYTTANGDTLVVGDADNPLTVTHRILNPSGASGYSGVEFRITGTLTHPELPLL